MGLTIAPRRGNLSIAMCVCDSCQSASLSYSDTDGDGTVLRRLTWYAEAAGWQVAPRTVCPSCIEMKAAHKRRKKGRDA